MLRPPLHLSRRALFSAGIALAATSAAGAATFHRLAVTSTTGSGGAMTFVQSTSSGGALQGEVSSSANTSIKLPFGILGEYNPSGSTFGIGVAGISTTGYAVAGESLGTQPSILGLAGGTGIGVEGVSSSNSSAAAVYGEASGSGNGGEFLADGGGNGVYAQSTGSSNAALAFAQGSGDGIFAYSANGFGLEVNNPNSDGVHSAVGSSAASGVVGINNAGGIGTYGVSVSGYGLEGVDLSGATPGATAPPALYAGSVAQSTAGVGLYGVNIHDTGTAIGYGTSGQPVSRYAGIFGFGNDGAGLYGYSFSDIGAVIENDSQLPTLVVNAQNTTSGDLEIAASAGNVNSDTINFSVDRSGNIQHSGVISSVTRNPQADVATYSAQQSESTVEDLGTAQLAGGVASVRIPDDFRSTTDGSARYMVFLTPYGDNNGLYISARSASGFTVREAHGGRDSLAFDYRVVAHPYGSARDERLPHIGRRMLAEAKRLRQGGGSVQHFDGAVRIPKIAPSHLHNPTALRRSAPDLHALR